MTVATRPIHKTWIRVKLQLLRMVISKADRKARVQSKGRTTGIQKKKVVMGGAAVDVSENVINLAGENSALHGHAVSFAQKTWLS